MARTELRARLRTRLDAAITTGALLPDWLTLALGNGPLGEDVGAWMELATDLLLYRVVYAVADPVVALGAATHDGARRETWRAELTDRLRARRGAADR